MKGFNPASVLGMTPDGALLYSSGSNDIQVFTVRLNKPDGALSTAQPMNPKSRRVTVSPAWSPDGRFFCYQIMEPEHNEELTSDLSIVMVRDVSTGREREVGRFPGVSRRISWTSDSKSLILPSSTAAGRNVLRVDVASGKSESLIPSLLINSHSRYSYPQMSPDGRYLYYADVSGTTRLMRVDLAQQQEQQLAIVRIVFALSPDGSEFVAPVADKNTTVLRVLGPNGETRRDLITVSALDELTSVGWSSDGRDVFFAKTIGGKETGFFRIPASGGIPVQVAVHTTRFPDLAVHPNGAELAFIGNRSDLEIWRLEGLSQAVARALQTPRTRVAQTQAKQ
jgi:Tol biopolymer transport system component